MENTNRGWATRVLWGIQGLLGLLFLFAGSMKLVLPIEEMTRQMALPGPFLRFIGVAEVAGAIGLILPGLLRIHVFLTPWAATGLAIIMVGATVITAVIGPLLAALFPMTVGVLATLVANRRWLPASRPSQVQDSALQAAH